MTQLIGIRVVPDAKISRYLLQPEHTVGGPKARFFLQYGFTQEQPGLLAEALILHAGTHPISFERIASGGVSRSIVGSLITPDSRNPAVLAVWYQAGSEALHRLVTAYPFKILSGAS